MPLATTEQYGRMLDAAVAGRYALPSVNVTSSETLNAAIRGFAEAGADGIVQVTVGGASFLGAGDALTGARALAQLAPVVADRAPVLVALHTDHCPPDHVADFLEPLIADSESASRAASRRCSARTCSTARGCRSRTTCGSRAACSTRARGRMLLEVECGVVGGEEDGIRGPTGPRRSSTRRPRTCCASPMCSEPASTAATSWRRRSATCTASTRPARPAAAGDPEGRAGGARTALAVGAVRVRLPRQQRLHRGRARRGDQLRGREGQPRQRRAVRVHQRDRRARVRQLARRAQARRRRRQAGLRPAVLGPRRGGGDGGPGARGVRAVRLRGRSLAA